MRFLSSRQHRGFTFAEVLITVAILSILATVVIISGEGPRKKARDEQRKSDLQQIQLALRLYKDAEGHYPLEYANEVIGSGSSLDAILTQYMSAVPVDPLNTENESEYKYDTNKNCNNPSSGTYIVLYATKMERPELGNMVTVCDDPTVDDEEEASGYAIILQKR